MADEHEIYNQAGIRITNLHLVIGARTYPISNIASVSMVEDRPSIARPLFYAALGVIFLVIYGLNFRQDGSLFSLILAAIFFALAGIIFATRKTTYRVMVISTAGEGVASESLGNTQLMQAGYVLESKDRAQIQHVVDALNEAIAQKG